MENIFFTDEGSGEAVVLISGLGGRASFWSQVVPLLSTHFRVITLDHPGVGQSQLDAEQPSITGIADAVIQILDHLQIARAHILGHSTGSLVTQTLALKHPDRVNSIVLSSGWAKPDCRFIDFFHYRKEILEQMGEDAYNELTRYMAYPSAYYGKTFKKEKSGASVENSANKDMILKRIDMLLNYSCIQELHTLQLPTLVIGAKDDYIVPFDHSIQLAQLIANAQLVELEGGHFTPKVKPHAYAEIIRSFWEAV
ncbi:alpha/beta hydrolase [Acinetobacter sp. ME22]|uniref:alpha/beta fold hydrolase n=1 Tax=Acinetobacter sp. ME22 TaxID=2904802 RepID=UPI001EDA534E|nr:alpha/beta hydrolase [Acinetobacter sp. ME22]MCG2574836.1 alpha/beta hydrolase [Acinetobacter sp. ME22]